MLFILNVQPRPNKTKQKFFFFFQIESGFFHESDIKIVGKSIKDRVALIKWKRERTVLLQLNKEHRDGDGLEKQKAQQAQLLIPVVGVLQVGQPVVLEPEEPEADQYPHHLNLPASATSVTCKNKPCF